MRKSIFHLVAILAAATAVSVGCAQSSTTSVATPSTVPTATEPVKTTSPASSTPTASTRKVSFPEKGKAVSIIVPYPAGGGSDIAARVLAPMLEQQLGTPVQVVNKAGAGSQVGVTDLALSKPDGYTIGYLNMPTPITTYLDPDRKAVFTRNSFQLLAMQDYDPGIVAVKADSPYKTLKDLVAAAKTNPEKIRGTTSGILSNSHLNILMLQQAAGAKFAIVHFDGAAPGKTALLGNHVEAYFGNLTDGPSLKQAGNVRVLAVAADQRAKFLPDIATYQEQGYNVQIGVHRGLAMPVGAPKEVADVLGTALKQVISSDDFKKKMDELTFTVLYMSPDEYSKFWADSEARIKPLMEMARQQ